MSQRLQDLIEPVVTDLGYELWHLENAGEVNARTVRVYIDAPEGISIEDCEAVSRELSAMLDVEDAGGGRYQLEVSSPGLDRPLASAYHFECFVGERANVRLYAPVAGKRRLKGVIRAVRGDAIDLDCDDGMYTLALGDMAKAKLEPVFEH